LIAVQTEPARALDWSTDTRLTEDLQWDAGPSVTHTSDGKIWVVWTSARTGNNEIFYKIHNGSAWSSETQLTYDSEKDINPSVIEADDGRIWVVWNTYRSEMDYDIYYKVFNGSSWSGDIQLVTELQDDNNPSVAQAADGRIWVVWSSMRTGNAEIFYKVFDGSSWLSDEQLTVDSNSDDEDPCVLQMKDGKIWVVYSKTARATGKWGDIYYKTFDGSNWSGEFQVTSDSQDDTHPAVMQSINGRIWIAWDSDRDGLNNSNIYYKILDGASWTPDTRLTNAMEPDKTPSITQNVDASIWIVWASQRIQDQLDLYYRKGMELHDIAVLSASSYPNHLNNTVAFRGEKVYLEVGVQNNGEAREPLVEVRCYINSSLVGSRVIALAYGQYYSLVFEWNTEPRQKRGIYVVSADVIPVPGETNVGNNVLVGDAFEVRIRGDIVGMYGDEVLPIPDGHVDIDDFLIPIIYFGDVGPNWPHPEWDPVADVTENLRVDLDDIMTVGVHHGET
jgi:hypothetical protein